MISTNENEVPPSKGPKTTTKLPSFIVNLESKMIKISGGIYQMGCDGTNDCEDTTMPLQFIKVDPFKISKYEVTQLEYETITGQIQVYFLNVAIAQLKMLVIMMLLNLLKN